MLPIVDYGSIAIVVPKVTAVGSTVSEEGKPGFEVFLSGMDEPIVIGFDTEEEALEAREELIAIIAQYHYVKELGPDFEINDLLGKNEDDEDINEH
jgi:hypothetical protein